MRNFKTIAIAFIVAFTTLTAAAQDKKINTKTSQINWVGKKVTGQHSGRISFQDGVLTMKKGKVTGGTFTVDMNTLTVTDLKAGEGKEKLEGHLKADDFFGTDKYKTAKLVFKSVTERAPGLYAVTADLTIKNITKPVSFELKAGKDNATTSFKVDRTKYGIEYKSGSVFQNLGDNAIYDEFDLTINLFF